MAYLPSILRGALLSLELGLGALLVAVLLGLGAAMASMANSKWLRTAVGVYSTVVRGVPDLILLFLFFYGAQLALNFVLEALRYRGFVEISPMLAGILSLGFIYGAYLCETFRGALLAVPKGQTEAGLALGMTRARVLRRLVLPQMVRFALPGFTNVWLVLLKSTALASLIGLQDMTYLANQAGAATRGQIANSSLVFLAFVAVLFLLITTVSLLLLRWLERKYSLGVKRVQF